MVPKPWRKSCRPSIATMVDSLKSLLDWVAHKTLSITPRNSNLIKVDSFMENGIVVRHFNRAWGYAIPYLELHMLSGAIKHLLAYSREVGRAITYFALKILQMGKKKDA
ncbi:hypothetical protein AAHA92_20624 [Salvia divinorum]|uniref:Uncharacterized protein n=1 Tax=Salvia divinorum TaxID=28513 RepID=A0ABD1GHU9_SALDI